MASTSALLQLVRLMLVCGFAERLDNFFAEGFSKKHFP